MSKQFAFVGKRGKGVLALRLKGEKTPQLYGNDRPLPAETPPDVITAGLANGTIEEWPADSSGESESPAESTELEAAESEVEKYQAEVNKEKGKVASLKTATGRAKAQERLEQAEADLSAAVLVYENLKGGGD